MSTRAKIIVFSLLGLLVAAGVAVTTVVVVINQNHKNDIAEADAVASDYLNEVTTFREEQAEIIADAAADSPEETLGVIDEALDEVPELGTAPAHGRENSADYAAALDVEKQVIADLESLQAVVTDAADAVDFIVATTEAIDRNTPGDLLGPGPFADGSHTRDAVVSHFEDVLANYVALEVPDGFDEVADLTQDALHHLLISLEEMATNLDNGQDGSFSFDPPYSDAEAALDEAVRARSDVLDAAIEAFGVGEEIEV